MQKYLDMLKICPLFQGVERDDLDKILADLKIRILAAEKNQFVLTEGEPADRMGIVLTGCVQVIREDYYGNRSLLAAVKPGELFAEAFACAGIDKIPVSVIAAEESSIMLIEYRRMLNLYGNAGAAQSRIAANLLRVVANKNLMLNRKIEFMSRRSTREKLMAFLLWQAKQEGKQEFSIPFDRQQLADYLGVERSAMSAELGKLQREGVIETKKRWFRLLGPEERRGSR